MHPFSSPPSEGDIGFSIENKRVVIYIGDVKIGFLGANDNRFYIEMNKHKYSEEISVIERKSSYWTIAIEYVEPELDISFGLLKI
jgi:hypothetical protein